MLRSMMAELSRRRVFRVAAVYAIGAWALVQAMGAVLPMLEAPAWVAKVLLAIALLGFPVALALAWAFDVTPDGVKRTEPLAGSDAGRVQIPAGSRALVVAAVVIIAVASGGWWMSRRDSIDTGAMTDAKSRMIAVLPFDNMSADPENEYFSDGITEDILAHLAKIDGLTVTSRTSVMQYKSTTKTVREIASELGVGAILEGSVRLANGRVRIVAQLIEAGTDRHLWAETYDRDVSDIFAVQTDVARNIAHALRVRLTTEDVAKLEQKPTENVQAYQLYLQGRHASMRLIHSELQAAITMYERATQLDPQFADAYAAIAVTHVLASIMAQTAPRTTYEPAIRATRRALELDPNSAAAHVALAALKIGFEWDWPGASMALDRALEIDPRNEDALRWKAGSLLYRERAAEGEAVARQAVAQDPNSNPLAAVLGEILVISGKAAEAIPVLEQAYGLNPTTQATNYWLMYAYYSAGRMADGDRAYERTFDNNQPVPLWQAVRAAIIAGRGQADEARVALTDFQRREKTGEYITPYAFFVLHGALGDMDSAMHALDRCVAEKSPVLIYIRATARLQPLRQDPRFMAALRAVWPDDFH